MISERSVQATVAVVVGDGPLRSMLKVTKAEVGEFGQKA